MKVLVFWIFGLLAPSLAIGSTNPGVYYKRAVKAYDQEQWTDAKKDFVQVYKLLKKQKARSKKQRVFLLLGQYDALYHLSIIEEKQNTVQKACFLYKDLNGKLDALPPEWKKWRPNPLLVLHFDDAKKRLLHCVEKIPSSLTLTGLPKNTIIEELVSQEGELPKKWIRVSSPFKTIKSKVTLRFTAVGYSKRLQTFFLDRWKSVTALTLLKKKALKKVAVATRPASIPVALRRPKPPVKTKKDLSTGAWVAIIGGGALFVAGVAAVVVLNQDDDFSSKKVTPIIDPEILPAQN